MNELSKRILVAALGIPIALGIIYLGNIPFLLVNIIIASLSLIEFYAIIEKKSSSPMKIYGVAMLIAILLSMYIFFESSYFQMILLANFILLIFGTMTIQLFSTNTNAISSISTTIFGVLYISLAFGSLILLREFPVILSNFEIVSDGNHFLRTESFLGYDVWGLFVIAIFITIWICDSAAYFVGKAIGKKKLFLRISPKKTWEGAIGGFIFSIISFLIAVEILIHDFPAIHSIILGSIIGIMGQIGDLAESQIKRDAGVKDSSSLLPGHGGILDRFDSVIFVAPSILIYFFFLLLFS